MLSAYVPQKGKSTKTKWPTFFSKSKTEIAGSDCWNRTVHSPFTASSRVSLVREKLFLIMCLKKNSRKPFFSFLFFLLACVQHQPVHWRVLVLYSVHYLLNIVDPIHWIIYFLPSWWKFYKRQRNRTKRRIK